MGLFEKFKGISEFNDKEAFMGMVYGVCACDGSIDDDELEMLSRAVCRLKLYKDCSTKDVLSIIETVNRANDKNGLDWLFLEAKRVLSLEQKKSAFTLAVDLAFADGSAGEAEEAFIEGIYKVLEIPDDYVAKALEVMEVRHNS
ncbi:MAG TPA: tellurite resistance TerB family protein [Kiritimatiellia bacterium]|nr:tellurite resistance TerB family protein [Kiritimatiellia bacterium]